MDSEKRFRKHTSQHYSADSTKNGIYRIKVDGAPGSEVRISTKATNSNSNASGLVFNDAVIFKLNTWETSRKSSGMYR